MGKERERGTVSGCVHPRMLSLSLALDVETEFIDRKLNLQFSGKVIH